MAIYSIPYHPYKILIIGGSRSGKTNAQLNLIKEKINNTLIDSAEDLDIAVPMYNLLECSKNYSKTTGSFWNYYRDEPNSDVGGANNNINYSIKDYRKYYKKIRW